jgi:hypothetical protein
MGTYCSWPGLTVENFYFLVFYKTKFLIFVSLLKEGKSKNSTNPFNFIVNQGIEYKKMPPGQLPRNFKWQKQ